MTKKNSLNLDKESNWVLMWNMNVLRKAHEKSKIANKIRNRVFDGNFVNLEQQSEIFFWNESLHFDCLNNETNSSIRHRIMLKSIRIKLNKGEHE